MSDIIQLLPDHVANQIAAGEVVQRPASVVKELLENAIDAKSTNIQLIVTDAGKTSIQVIDNGQGMSPTDAQMCFERHATSKIKQAEDLFKIQSKGFRGEAMASIAAIAQVSLKTKKQDETEDTLGTHLQIEGSKVVNQEPYPMESGTNIKVKNLFYNIPARRNFLKSDPVESRHIIQEFQRVALAHPEIGFSLESNGTELYRLPPRNLKQRIDQIFGHKNQDKLIPINENTEVVNLSGYVGRPQFAKKKRGEQFFFVNNRYIKSAYLQHAVKNAFEGLISSEQHPSFFLYLEIDPSNIDINIHPTKTEIKFEDEKIIYAVIRSSVKHSLGQFQAAPALDFDKDPTLETPYGFKKEKNYEPYITVDPDFNPFKTEESVGEKKVFKNNYNQATYQKKEADWEHLYSHIEVPSNFSSVSKNEEEKKVGLPFEQEKNASNTHSLLLDKKYILTKVKTGILLIHQSRAHQRILFEQLKNNIDLKQLSSQQLLFPYELILDPSTSISFNELEQHLIQMGFAFEKKEAQVMHVCGIPTEMNALQIQSFFEHLFEKTENSIPIDIESINDFILKAIVKSSAIKSGTELSDIERESLIQQLFMCQEQMLSPFNKKIIKTIGIEQINLLFEQNDAL